VLTGFWLVLTHLQSRFFVLGIPILALLIGQVRWRPWPWLAGGVLIVMAGVAWWGVYSRLHPFTGILGIDRFEGLLPSQALTAPSDSRIVLVGDAKAFWYQIPMSRLGYRTVFDVDAGNGRDVVSAWLGDAGRKPHDLVIIDSGELGRFARTYWAIPPLSDSVPRPRDRVFVLP